ncbi:MAG: hypothetical protein NT126_05995 [Bacteroidetes bacterium]|nr:hypothetical protein [Bacteroidota bacterium]
MKKYFLLFPVLLLLAAYQADAQCAMCRRVAETSMESNHKKEAAKSLNSGILYLLSVPYLIGAVAAMAWWKNRRKES